jgi:hypothetical protein
MQVDLRMPQVDFKVLPMSPWVDLHSMSTQGDLMTVRKA